VKTDRKRRIGLVLHLQGQVELRDDQGFREDPEFGKRFETQSFRYWSDTRTANFTDRASLQVRYPDLVMSVTFEVPGDFTLTHAESPDTPPGRRQTLYLEKTSSEVVFKTVFEPVSTVDSRDE